ncbi:MAG: cation:dicarboxylase symporter family transporter [Bradyrhizobium sp.]
MSREVVGLVMPGGFSFNMDGTAIYMTTAVLFLANAFNVHLSIWHQLSVLFVMLFTSKGAAGSPGAASLRSRPRCRWWMRCRSPVSRYCSGWIASWRKSAPRPI